MNVCIAEKYLMKHQYHLRKIFTVNQNLEGISDEDYAHAQKVWEVFEIRNCGEYHDLYVQTDTLLPAHVFEKFRDKCIEIYGLGMASLFKKGRSKIRIINRYSYVIND